MLDGARQRFWTRRASAAAVLCCLVALSGCWDGGSASDPPAKLYTLSATVSGLNAPGLTVSLNATSLWSPPHSTVQLVVPADATSLMLTASLASGAGYAAAIAAQPVGEACTLANGSGAVYSANPANVVIACVDHTYTVGGAITGLTASGLVLLDNGGDALTLSANAAQFTMNTGVAYGRPYAITVQTAPAGLVCRVSDGTGIMGAADVTSITIGCVPNFALLYTFAGGNDGANPHQYSLLQGSDGNFYGATLHGGKSNDGTVFQITPSGTETVLYSFTGYPSFAGMIQASDGNFYGTTANGGTKREGSFFELTPSGTETDLYSFSETKSFGGPYSGVIEGSDGNFYGTTYLGGTSSLGSVFKITPSGVESTLHSFTGGADGSAPADVPLLASDGNFYGTTQTGGTSGDGTVFKLTPSGNETVLHSFTGGTADGADPYASVIEGSDGNFYGTTQSGGTSGDGTVYEVTPSGVETVLHSFAGGTSDGLHPYAGLVRDGDGNFYGTTYLGGTSNLGTIYQITPSGVETVLHSFDGSDGANPKANLILGSDGNLYGETYAGGTSGYGTFFKLMLR